MSGFDWAGAHLRLDALRRTLESGGAPSPEEAEKTLRERASLLARPEGARVPEAALRLLVFSRETDSYGVEISDVLEALPVAAPTPLPGRRPGLTGVTSYRAGLIAVADLGGLRNPATAPSRSEGRIVVVRARGMTLGLLADGISGFLQVAAAEVTPGTPGPEAWVKGTTSDLVSVLDLDTLVQDPRIRVEDF